MGNWRVGIDIGGTFTDVVAMNEETGAVRVTKVSSVPSDPSQAVANGLKNLIETNPDIAPEHISFFAHGTTVATNATIEGKGARTGLLITKGLRAVYDMRGGARPVEVDLIDSHYKKPVGLVPQYLTHEIGGRIAFDGSEIDPLDEEAVRTAARALRDQGVRSIAVCFMFAFMNAAHENRTKEIILEEFPECRVSLSSFVLPTVREYLRLSTTVLDAYAGPVVSNYLKNVTGRLREEGVDTESLFIMQSNGGLMQIDLAAEYPNQTLLSGPAAGVVFASTVGELTGERNIVTFDIGGTSTDISVLPDNKFSETRRGRIHDQDIGTPMIQIQALGAGGGTIGWIGPDGLLKGGPQSAGADPGPACYGLGGDQPTVTDANILLGRLNPHNFIGGRFKIDPDLARKVIEEKIAIPLGISVEEAALGLLRVVSVNMEVGVRLAFVERGLDPRRFSLLAFGGGGPVMASRVAKEVGLPKVIVPAFPGISCAIGLLQTDVKHTYLQSRIGGLDSVPVEELNRLFGEQEERARKEAASEGFAPEDILLQRQLDLRYPFQGYELTIDCPSEMTEDDKPAIRSAFDALHEETFGTSAPGEMPEIVNVRVVSTGKVEKLDFRPIGKAAGPVAPKAHRPVLFELAEGYVETPIYDRASLRDGHQLSGPAIVEQLDSTTVVFPGQTVDVDSYGNLIITV